MVSQMPGCFPVAACKDCSKVTFGCTDNQSFELCLDSFACLLLVFLKRKKVGLPFDEQLLATRPKNTFSAESQNESF